MLVHTGFSGPSNLHVYVRLDPTVGGNGGGGTDNAGADSATADRTALVAGDTNTQTVAANRDYAQPTFLALEAEPRLQGRLGRLRGDAPATGSRSSTARRR